MSTGQTDGSCESAPKIQTGTLSVRSKDDGLIDLAYDRMAIDTTETLMLLSVVTEGMKAKALRAMLSFGSRTSIKAAGTKLKKSSDEYGRNAGNFNIKAGPDGYESYVHKLGFGMVHALFVSRSESFMPVADEAAVWAQVRDVRFTTPVMREWIAPYVLPELERRALLKRCLCHRAECAVLLATDKQLDDVIEKGISEGHISIPEPGIIDTTARQINETKQIGGPT
jgi:hypothetical protein